MNRKKKINQALKSRLKKTNAKLHNSNKPKYVSKADRVKLALSEAEVSVILETERLSINVLVLADAHMIQTLFNEPNVLKFIGNKNINTINDAEKYIVEEQQTKHLEFGYSFYCIRLKENDTPIGICGLVKRSNSEPEELGFAVLSDYYRKGYIKEACQAVVNFAKTDLKLTSLFAKTNTDNEASIVLLKSLGFKTITNVTDDKLMHYTLTF